MSDGKHCEPTLEVEKTDDLRPELLAFAKWLLSDARTLEVWGLAGAKAARVECVSNETQSLELDSGDWFLVRVSSMPTTTSVLPTMPGTSGIIRFRRSLALGRSGHGKGE